jgi:hypothetical protein
VNPIGCNSRNEMKKCYQLEEGEAKETNATRYEKKEGFLSNVCRTNFRHRFSLIFTLQLISYSLEFSIHQHPTSITKAPYLPHFKFTIRKTILLPLQYISYPQQERAMYFRNRMGLRRETKLSST